MAFGMPFGNPTTTAPAPAFGASTGNFLYIYLF